MVGNRDYKTWQDYAKAVGVYDQFSAEQLAIAENDPDYGWATASNKAGWASATTPEEKAKYHQTQVELNRTKGFTGGTDGSLYDVTPTQVQQNSTRDALTSYGDFSYSRAPDYQAALARVTNRDPFSYDYKSDPVYSSYAKQYTREGRRASEDTMGQYAAMTGGRPSTAAITASQQAGNYYGAQLADKIPELYQQAYQRYLDEYTMQLKALNALDTDRSFEYGVYGDKYNRLGDAYNVAASENAAAIAAVNDAEKTAYQRKIYDDETKYAREQDALERQAANEKNEWQKYLEEWEMQNTDKKNAMSEADWRASRGQYDQMAELLGMSVDEVKSRYEQPTTGGYSGTGRSGSTTTDFYDAAAGLRKAGITNETEAKRWLMSEYPGMSEKEAKAYAADYFAIYGETPEAADPYHGYSESEYNWARNNIDSFDKNSPSYKRAKAILTENGWEFDQTPKKDGVANTPGDTHDNGLPMSKMFKQVLASASTFRKDKDKVADLLEEMVNKKQIHEYEIDVILDYLYQ